MACKTEPDNCDFTLLNCILSMLADITVYENSDRMQNERTLTAVFTTLNGMRQGSRTADDDIHTLQTRSI